MLKDELLEEGDSLEDVITFWKEKKDAVSYVQIIPFSVYTQHVECYVDLIAPIVRTRVQIVRLRFLSNI